MLFLIDQALGSPSEMFKVPNYFTPLLSGLPKGNMLIIDHSYAFAAKGWAKQPNTWGHF